MEGEKGNMTERKLTNKDFREIVLTARSSEPIKIESNMILEKKNKKIKKHLHKLKENQMIPGKRKDDEIKEETDIKYRDRAKERRDGLVNDIEPIEIISKVEDIIQNKPLINNELLLQNTINKSTQNQIEFELKCNSIFARNICNILFEKNSKVCENFQNGRTTYSYNISDNVDPLISTLPITLIRSRINEKNNNEYIKVASKNIINKLNTVLSYMRGENAKNISSKKEEIKSENNDINIYDDIEEYNEEESLKKHEEKDKIKEKTYFEKSNENSNIHKSNKDILIKDLISNKKLKKSDQNSIKLQSKLDQLTGNNESYMECYIDVDHPNLSTIINNSDEEEDITKINQKPLINPWDFPSQQEYQKYLQTKQSILKGKRTTKDLQPKSKANKNKFNKEWEQISQIISTRKSTHEPLDNNSPNIPIKKPRL